MRFLEISGLVTSGRRALSTVAVAAAMLGTAHAQSPLVSSDDDTWHFSVTPYLFLPVSTTGDSTVAGATAAVDLDLMDVFEALNFAAAGRAEAWKGRFGIMGDVYYANLGGGSTVTLPGPAGGTARVDISSKQGWASLLGGYRLLEGSLDPGLVNTQRFAVDVGAGVRYDSLRQEVDASLNVDIGPGIGFQRTLGGTETWWEPVVMLRGSAQIDDRWTAGARVEMGGFGVNGSDLQWLALAGFDYRAWENTSLKLGWQFYGIDYSTTRADGLFAYDVFQTGPYMGATFNF